MASARVYTEQVAVKTECVGETPLTGARKYDQATPVLNVMPWLPVCRRIDILAPNNSNVPFQNFLPPLPFFRSGVPEHRFFVTETDEFIQSRRADIMIIKLLLMNLVPYIANRETEGINISWYCMKKVFYFETQHLMCYVIRA